MRRNIAIALLALGTVLGYGSGIAHLACHRHDACRGWHGHESPPPASDSNR
jgi:hypothetical protein